MALCMIDLAHGTSTIHGELGFFCSLFGDQLEASLTEYSIEAIIV